jgi:hypothetical protein
VLGSLARGEARQDRPAGRIGQGRKGRAEAIGERRMSRPVVAVKCSLYKTLFIKALLATGCDSTCWKLCPHVGDIPMMNVVSASREHSLPALRRRRALQVLLALPLAAAASSLAGCAARRERGSDRRDSRGGFFGSGGGFGGGEDEDED